MNILIASDKFKGSMSAGEACTAIAHGIGSEFSEVRQIPVADGGDGMATALTEAKDGQWVLHNVQGPLGKSVSAGYGLWDEGRTAAIEMAEASGLALLGNQPNDPWTASTFGTGELIRDAINRGVETILLGIGGSATNDGGVGMAVAAGYLFIDSDDEIVANLPGDLQTVAHIERPDDIDSFPQIIVACDVTNPLLGENGCTRVYGPQKGIADTEFARHESRLEHLVQLTQGEETSLIPGAGAAGGLGFGASVFLDAELVPGFDLVAEVLKLEQAVDWADLVITGEGKIDSQSLQGKAPAGVARLAKDRGKPVVGFCGISGEGDFTNTFDEIFEIDRGELSVTESMARGFELLLKTSNLAIPKLKQHLVRR